MPYHNAIEVSRGELFIEEVELRERYPRARVDKVLFVDDRYDRLMMAGGEGG